MIEYALVTNNETSLGVVCGMRLDASARQKEYVVFIGYSTLLSGVAKYGVMLKTRCSTGICGDRDGDGVTG